MTLSNEQKVLYLANVIAMARADGQLSPVEEAAIEVVQKSIGARKTELNKAFSQAEKEQFQPTPVGFWSNKIKNLEDIIYVSMIDGVVDNLEKKLLLSFAKQIQISQDQLNLIISDVKNEIATTAVDISCPNCKAKISKSVKFCPECGVETQKAFESETVAVSYEIPLSGIAIEFAESTASSFSHAVQNHQNAPINKTCVKGKKTWYLASWPKNNISLAQELVGNLKGIRNRKVYVDGKESQWDDVFGFSWCFNSRKSAYRPNEYCFGLDEKQLNVWGCKQTRMDWTEWADWFGYGAFKDKGMFNNQVSFVFDKKRIRHELETNLFKYRFCPHLRFKLIEAVIDSLPDEVSPSEKGSWGYKKDYDESPGSILVKVKTKEDGYTYTDEYYSSGVIPNSIDVGLKLLKNAFKTCGYPASITKSILEYKG